MKRQVTVVHQEFLHRYVALPHGGILEPGYEQYMGRHARRKQPCGYLVVERVRRGHPPEMSQDVAFGVFATPVNPLPFGMVYGYRHLEFGQPA